MEQTIEQKLESLLYIQSIDSKIDEIKIVRGDLPEEVRDIEDEIAGFDTRVQKFNDEIKEHEDTITALRNTIKDAEKHIKKYEEQQSNVRNNREYDAISKEIELQQLEIQLCEKRIKEALYKIDLKKKDIEAIQEQKKQRMADLEIKKSELDTIVAESEEEINKLMQQRAEAVKKVEERLYHSYEKLRKNHRNGLAVVKVKRDACGGCFNAVPPQRQAEIKEKKKIIVCEHCGRILAGVEANPSPEPQAKKIALAKELRDF